MVGDGLGLFCGKSISAVLQPDRIKIIVTKINFIFISILYFLEINQSPKMDKTLNNNSIFAKTWDA